jgi:hypothetical protein
LFVPLSFFLYGLSFNLPILITYLISPNQTVLSLYYIFFSIYFIQRQWNQNDGKCGTCGDPYDGERKNEAGGKYATGFIARRYSKGQDIDVEVKLTANHLGFFEFKLCPQNDIKTPVTQECLDRYVLEIVGSPGVTRYEPGSKNGMHYIKLALPAEVTCEQCVLQWHYKAGNLFLGHLFCKRG